MYCPLREYLGCRGGGLDGRGTKRRFFAQPAWSGNGASWTHNSCWRACRCSCCSWDYRPKHKAPYHCSGWNGREFSGRTRRSAHAGCCGCEFCGGESRSASQSGCSIRSGRKFSGGAPRSAHPACSGRKFSGGAPRSTRPACSGCEFTAGESCSATHSGRSIRSGWKCGASRSSWHCGPIDRRDFHSLREASFLEIANEPSTRTCQCPYRSLSRLRPARSTSAFFRRGRIRHLP